MERCTMTVKEIAAYIGLHMDTIYDMFRDGKLPHFCVGKRILFSKKTKE